jgi:hypothetical protein
MNRKRAVIIVSVIVALPLVYILGNHLNKKIQRDRCAENLRNLGKAIAVYVNDYSDEYHVQGSGFSDTNLPGKLRVEYDTSVKSQDLSSIPPQESRSLLRFWNFDRGIKYIEPNETTAIGASLYSLENDEVADVNGL